MKFKKSFFNLVLIIAIVSISITGCSSNKQNNEKDENLSEMTNTQEKLDKEEDKKDVDMKESQEEMKEEPKKEESKKEEPKKEEVKKEEPKKEEVKKEEPKKEEVKKEEVKKEEPKKEEPKKEEPKKEEPKKEEPKKEEPKKEEVKKEEPKKKYKDGSFTGAGKGYNGDVMVSVTISNDKIVSVDVISSAEDEPYMTQATGVISSIVSSQSPSVATVSGATVSADAIKVAVSNALASAKN